MTNITYLQEKTLDTLLNDQFVLTKNLEEMATILVDDFGRLNHDEAIVFLKLLFGNLANNKSGEFFGEDFNEEMALRNVKYIRYLLSARGAPGLGRATLRKVIKNLVHKHKVDEEKISNRLQVIFLFRHYQDTLLTLKPWIRRASLDTLFELDQTGCLVDADLIVGTEYLTHELFQRMREKGYIGDSPFMKFKLLASQSDYAIHELGIGKIEFDEPLPLERFLKLSRTALNYTGCKTDQEKLIGLSVIIARIKPKYLTLINNYTPYKLLELMGKL